MTEKEANKILQKKYPQGYIRYNDLGRKSNTNRVVLVSFTKHGKDYRYTGSYADVLIRLGCMDPIKYDTIYTRDYNPETGNMFINAMREAGSNNK